MITIVKYLYNHNPTVNLTAGKGYLHEEEIIAGLKKMKNGKATGIDDIPAEIYKVCPVCKQALIMLLQKIWKDEVVPKAFAQAKFVMLFKNKGSSDDPTRYRCLGMLNHSYKVLTQCLLARLEKETKGFLSDWQAGFRTQRGCRDNILVLRSLCDAAIEKGEQIYITFID